MRRSRARYFHTVLGNGKCRRENWANKAQQATITGGETEWKRDCAKCARTFTLRQRGKVLQFWWCLLPIPKVSSHSSHEPPGTSLRFGIYFCAKHTKIIYDPRGGLQGLSTQLCQARERAAVDGICRRVVVCCFFVLFVSPRIYLWPRKMVPRRVAKNRK